MFFLSIKYSTDSPNTSTVQNVKESLNVNALFLVWTDNLSMYVTLICTHPLMNQINQLIK